MDSTGSLLRTVIRRVRHYTDTPSMDRHTDAFLIEEVIPAKYQNLFNLLRLSDEHPVLLMHSMTVPADSQGVVLPPCVGEVWRVAKLDAIGHVTNDWRPRGEFHLLGPGWSLEQNELRFRPYPSSEETWLLFYTPSGSVSMHIGTGSVISPTVIQFAATPTLGSLDRRSNAYAGQILRIIEAGRVVQERIVTAYDAVTRQATVRIAFTQDANHLPANGQNVSYEVSPRFNEAMIDCLAYMVSLSLAASKGFSAQKLRLLEYGKDEALKTLRDQWGQLIIRTGKSLDRNTIDHPERNDMSGIVIWGNADAMTLGSIIR